jgi:hypothetical protein
MLRLSRQRSYTVPVLMRALDILEFLQRNGSSFLANQISAETKVPLSSTYRIVRTLVQRGYLEQSISGRYSFKTSTTSPDKSLITKGVLNERTIEEDAVAIVFALLQRSLSNPPPSSFMQKQG